MNPFKAVFRSLLRSAGYDVRKTSHVGLDATADVQRIFQKTQLRTILDIGAHLGESALAYAKSFPHAIIYSFEPSPQTFTALREAVAPCGRIKPVQQAVGAECQSQKFFLNKFSATNSMLPTIPNVAHADIRSLMENVESVDVPVTTLDFFCSRNHLEAIDLLKLDVQGFESEVLSGARVLLEEERVALVYTEVTFENHYAGQTTFAQLYAMLTQSGFELVDIYGQTRTSHHSIRWCDMLFVNPRALEKALFLK